MLEIKVNTSLLGLKDINLHVEDHGGNGRPIILIHGWLLSGASWKKQVPVLQKAGFRVITYDRRGFGNSDKPLTGYGYDTFAEDLNGLIESLNLKNVTLVGFSMGGGEVARYIAQYGEDRLHSVVFAASITPMMMNLPNNPEGPLDKTTSAKMAMQITSEPDAFYKDFTRTFFSPNDNGRMLVTDAEHNEAISLCQQASKVAVLESMQSFAISDFRDDIAKVTVPTLIIHGDADGIVPFNGSGARTHKAITHSKLHIIKGGPHGINATQADEFNTAILDFLATNSVNIQDSQRKIG